MKVENMTNSKGNKVANQFLIYDDDKKVFQSYSSKIVTLLNGFDQKLILYGSMWDYSNTTRKYFKQFINEETSFNYQTKKQWEQEIKNNRFIEVV